jgi:Zn finger protein HypA/HybF involved in hydrogenase expression
MHELFVTEQIRDIAVRYANEAGAGRITALYLVIGELSSIVDDSVQFYWDFVSEGTVAAGASSIFAACRRACLPGSAGASMGRTRASPARPVRAATSAWFRATSFIWMPLTSPNCRSRRTWRRHQPVKEIRWLNVLP